jgi:hypothetical protein
MIGIIGGTGLDNPLVSNCLAAKNPVGMVVI